MQKGDRQSISDESGEKAPEKSIKEATPWWVLSTYFAEGFPYYIMRIAIPYFLKTSGYSNTISGLASLAFTPWAFKALWAPVVDLYATKRKWIIALEFSLAFIFSLLALWMYLNPEVSLSGVWGITFWVLVFSGAFLSATQDIAIDAAYIENLKEKQQALWSGTRVAAYRVAIIAGKSGILVIAGTYSWYLALASAALIFLLTALVHLRTLPDVRINRRRDISVTNEFKESLSTFLLRDKAILVLLFALFYKFGDALLFSMSNNFLDDLQVETVYIGVIGSSDLLMAILGGLLGGWLIARFGMVVCLLPFAFIMNGADLIYAFYASLDLDLEMIKKTAFIVTGAEQFAGGIGTAAYMFVFIIFSRGEHSASHYALLTSVMALEVLLAAPFGGVMADYFIEIGMGWQSYFIFCFVMSIPGMLIASLLLGEIRLLSAIEPAEGK